MAAFIETVTTDFAVWEVKGYVGTGPVALARYQKDGTPYVRLSQVGQASPHPSSHACMQ